MLKNYNIKLLNELFLTCYSSYNNTKNISNTESKIYHDFVDVLYDGMDTVLEILDMCGANK